MTSDQRSTLGSIPLRMSWWGTRRVSEVSFILWVALFSADRIDFLGGEGAFVLTPFLVLTPPLLAWEVFRLAEERERLHFERPAAAYLLLLLLFLAVVLVSGLLAMDALLSARRAALLTVLGVGTLLVAGLWVGRDGGREALITGAKLGLMLALVFDVLQVVVPLLGFLDPLPFLTGTVNLMPHGFMGLIPRLSGQVADANRGGFLILFYLFVLLRWGAPGRGRRRWVTLGAVLLIMTFSRSAILAAMVTGTLAWMEGWKLRLARKRVLATMGLVAVLASWLLVGGDSRTTVLRTLEPLSERLSPGEGSAREHVYLLGRGMRVATESVKHASIGIGYGNGTLILQDVFPGNKYANWHSLYLSVLVDSGVGALVLILVLIVVPCVLPGPVRPFLGGIIVFNIFYQSIADPPFWFALALAWLTVRGRKPSPGNAPSEDSLIPQPE